MQPDRFWPPTEDPRSAQTRYIANGSPVGRPIEWCEKNTVNTQFQGHLPPLPFPSLPRLPNPARGLGDRFKLPHLGPGHSASRKRIFEPRKRIR